MAAKQTRVWVCFGEKQWRERAGVGEYPRSGLVWVRAQGQG